LSDTVDILKLPARLDSLEPFLAFVLEKAMQAGASQGLLGDIKLCMEEVLTNIFFHAYPGSDGRVEVNFSAHSDGMLRIEITDWGIAFNPCTFEATDLERDFCERNIGGMGICLARNLSHQMLYERSGGANHLKIAFLLDSG
jgi:serine/threonine-protein kinase RsbW